MLLNYRKYGQGPPMIILHGLYGSSDNWITIARELEDHFEIYLIDQRNHGESPHMDEHNYEVLKNDLLHFMDSQGIEKAILLGHSMGGKTAIFFASAFPSRVESLIVVDISPRSYLKTDHPIPHKVDHKNILMAMRNIDLQQADSRMDVDMMLADTIKSQRIRQFLLKNVTRKDKENFTWKLNLEALHNSLSDIMDGLNPDDFDQGKGISGFPVLFIKGEHSDYIGESDYSLIQKIFPAAEIVTIPNAGHWLHAEQKDLFIKNVRYFLGVNA